MVQKNVFINWIMNNSKLSSSTAGKYAGAINTISNELKKEGLLGGNMYYISDPVLIDALIIQYFSIPKYEAKNIRGNRMYSNALKYYKSFVGYQNRMN